MCKLKKLTLSLIAVCCAGTIKQPCYATNKGDTKHPIIINLPCTTGYGFNQTNQQSPYPNLLNYDNTNFINHRNNINNISNSQQNINQKNEQNTLIIMLIQIKIIT